MECHLNTGNPSSTNTATRAPVAFVVWENPVKLGQSNTDIVTTSSAIVLAIFIFPTNLIVY